MRRVVMTGLLLALMAHVIGAEPLTLRAALEQARQGAGEAVAGRERAQAAAERVRQAKGYRFPSLSLQEIFTRTDSPAEAFALKLNQERFSFPEFMTSDPNQPDALNTAITRVEATMPLFTGGELSGRIAQAELAATAADGQARWAAEQAALAAGEAYVMVEQAREYVALLRKARETVAAHVKLAEAYAEQGMLVLSEVLRARVELSRLDDLVAEAEGRARVAEANLSFRLGKPQGTAWQLETLPPPAPLTGSYDEWAAASDYPTRPPGGARPAGRRGAGGARTQGRVLCPGWAWWREPTGWTTRCSGPTGRRRRSWRWRRSTSSPVAATARRWRRRGTRRGQGAWT